MKLMIIRNTIDKTKKFSLKYEENPLVKKMIPESEMITPIFRHSGLILILLLSSRDMFFHAFRYFNMTLKKNRIPNIKKIKPKTINVIFIFK